MNRERMAAGSLLSPVPEFIDPVFTKTSPKRSFSLNRKRAFWLVFAKTGSIISGTGEDKSHPCVWMAPTSVCSDSPEAGVSVPEFSRLRAKVVPARQAALCIAQESIPWNRCLGTLEVKKFGLSVSLLPV
jgi:hypothetical protein